MTTLKVYNKDTLEVIFTKTYKENFSIFETSLSISKDEIIPIQVCMLRLFLPSQNNLEELLNLLNDKVIIEASDEGGVIIRILASVYNYKMELHDEPQELLALNIHEKIYKLK